MAPNTATRYTEAMKDHPFGHALFVPESSTALMPAACGYIDSLGRWAPGPKKSALVNITKFGTNLAASAIPAGFPASVKLVLDFASSSSFSSILHCPKPVMHEGYYHRKVFLEWAKKNAEKLLQLVPDVKEHGFWIVTDTYSTADVRVITWSDREKHVQMGFDVDVTPAGEIGPSGEFFEGASAGEWHRAEAETDEKLVVFFAGVRMKYRRLPLGRASVKEVRDEEEPVVVSDSDDMLYQAEPELIGFEPRESD
ncbi:hypothetical protein CEP51_007653 [Fusarium floridanum]|uniref:Uncharacterized protein n=1 Tax=Fusarium floridanum TaxID=1325733 RepID=A0A428RNH3_9HYPO|nr:hypothetical protein CEP51_007653 [Fusarium floridanum]